MPRKKRNEKADNEQEKKKVKAGGEQAAQGAEATGTAEEQRFLEELGKLPDHRGLWQLVWSSPQHVRANQRWVLAAVKKKGNVLVFAADSLKAHKEVVVAAVSQRVLERGSPLALEYATDSLKADKEVVLAAVANHGQALYYATDSLKADKEVVLAAVAQNGDAIEYGNKTAPMLAALAAVAQNGLALKNASEVLKSDKDVVMVAAQSHDVALKFAKSGLNQDPDCMKAAGIFDEDVDHKFARKEKAVLSVKFQGIHDSG